MTVGWAVILLFGRVPGEKRTLLSFIALGSLAWLGAVIAVSIPGVEAFLLAAVPRPGVRRPRVAGVDRAGDGDPDAARDRRRDDQHRGPQATARRARAFVIQLLRGYLYAPVMAFTILFLAAVAIVRKVRSLQNGWASDSPARDHQGRQVREGRRGASRRRSRTPGSPVRAPVRASRVLEVAAAPPRRGERGRGSRHASSRTGSIQLRRRWPRDPRLPLGHRAARRREAPRPCTGRAIAQRLAFTDAYLTHDQGDGGDRGPPPRIAREAARAIGR